MKELTKEDELIKNTTFKMDTFVSETISEILLRGADSQGSRPIYASDGETANSKYITDVFVKFDLSKGELPITSLRPVGIKLAIEELFWIYVQETSDLNLLRERGVQYWNDWEMDDGTIGQRYGATVKKYNIVGRLLEGLEKNPFNRRNVINLWQYEDLDIPAPLPPCAFQVLFDVRKINGEMYLDASLTQRSGDFLVAGVGINQMQYVALQMMVAKHFGWKVGTFSWHVMNLHIYDRHIEAAKIMQDRYHVATTMGHSPIKFYLDVPDKTNFYDIQSTDFKIEGYSSVGKQLKFDMAV